MNIALVLVLIGVGVPLIWLIATYNRFIALKQHLRESWSDIDVELKRRYELIPNLVEVAKGYAKHERELFERVTQLRNAAVASQGAANAQAADEEKLCLGLRQVFAVAESYPALRADAQFLALQKQLAETEDRIAAARRLYNGNVRDLNRLREQFPTNFVAGMAGASEAATYFELSDAAERVVPRVQIAGS